MTPYPDQSPWGEIGRSGSPAAYLIDPGAGSGSDRVTRFWPDRVTLDDIHRRGGSITPLWTRPTSVDAPHPSIEKQARAWIAQAYPTAVDTAGADRLVHAFAAGMVAKGGPLT